MNKVILMGRLTKDIEVNFINGKDGALAAISFSLAVNRKFKRENEPEADFINCVAFGKLAEFIAKHFRKGNMIAVIGRLQVRSYEDKNGFKKWSTNVIVEEADFTGEKNSNNTSGAEGKNETPDGFYPVSEDLNEDDLPF